MPGDGSDFSTMNDLYAFHNSPSPRAIIQSVPESMGANDVDLSTLPAFVLQDLLGEDVYTFKPSALIDTFNPNGLGTAPLLVVSDKAVKIDSGYTVTGRGLLMIKHGLEVEGTLNWDGMVLVHSERDTLNVVIHNAEGGVNINGSFVIEHDAPPPGGHMDLTVWRDTDGTWSNPMGVHTSGKRNNLRHTHRFGNKGGGWHEGGNQWKSCGNKDICPEDSRPEGDDAAARRVVFLEKGKGKGKGKGKTGSVHETHTQFAQLLDDLDKRPVYLQIGDSRAVQQFDGHTDISLKLKKESLCLGTAQGGFSTLCRDASNPHRTTVFEAKDLESLVLDIGSLRMLKHLTNWDPFVGTDADTGLPYTNDPDNEVPATCPTNDSKLESWLGPISPKPSIDFKVRNGNCVSDNYPGDIAFLKSRGGALRLQVRDARPSHEGKLLYEAAMYWHTKEPSHAEYKEEAKADEEFFDAVANGDAYGAHIQAGDKLNIDFEMTVIDPLIQRLNLDLPATVERASAQIERVPDGTATLTAATCSATP